MSPSETPEQPEAAGTATVAAFRFHLRDVCQSLGRLTHELDAAGAIDHTGADSTHLRY